ncbi:MAG: hypothetical protein V1870_02085 [Candidatus Aenigmatarchaeota archaeon]
MTRYRDPLATYSEQDIEVTITVPEEMMQAALEVQKEQCTLDNPRCAI